MESPSTGFPFLEPRIWRFRDPDAPALFLRVRDTALHIVCWHPSCPVASVVEPLLDAHPDAALLGNGGGRTPLHLACWRGSDGAVLALLRRRPDAASAQDRNGKSPLRDACLMYRSAEVLRALVAADRSMIDTADRWGWTPTLGFFRVALGRLEGVLRGGVVAGGGDARARCEDVLERAAVLLAAEAGLPPGASTWEIAAASITSPSCPYSVFALLVGMHPNLASVMGPSLSAEYLLHVATGVPPRSLQQLNLYHCDKCKVLPCDGDAIFCNACPREAYWGVRCIRCLVKSRAENYEVVFPKVDKTAAVIERLLSIDPHLAGIPGRDGNLPLVSAIKSGKEWDGGIKPLFLAAPGALHSRDVETLMLPFMISAVANRYKERPEGHCVDNVDGAGDAGKAEDLRRLQTVFGLIMEDPTVIELGLLERKSG